MFVAVCVVALNLHGVHSLKEKRSIVKSLTSRLHREFNLSVAEVDGQDAWQSTVLGMAAVGNDKAYLHKLLQTCVSWIEQNRPDVPIDDYRIEFC